ncbi:TerD family protein [Cohnella sp. GCM10020058]|uniref:TerD family protein n=1 Tax=Cohnella sp. GCM10020058 TaxID=3317330 RepID=UPI003628D49E
MQIQRGQRIDLTAGGKNEEIELQLEWQASTAGLDINGSAFLLNADGICARDEDFIFYNQPVSRQHAVRHATENGGGTRESLRISFPRMPEDVVKLAITLTIHDAGGQGGRDLRRSRACVMSHTICVRRGTRKFPLCRQSR